MDKNAEKSFSENAEKIHSETRKRKRTSSDHEETSKILNDIDDWLLSDSEDNIESNTNNDTQIEHSYIEEDEKQSNSEQKSDQDESTSSEEEYTKDNAANWEKLQRFLQLFIQPEKYVPDFDSIKHRVNNYSDNEAIKLFRTIAENIGLKFDPNSYAFYSNSDSTTSSPSIEGTNQSDSNSSDEKYKLLYDATKEGNILVINNLLTNGVNIDAKTARGYTILHYAAARGHVDVVKFLLNKGANVNAKTAGSLIIFDLIEEIGFLPLKEVFFKDCKGVHINNPSDYTALHLAVALKHKDIVKLLLDSNADASATDANNQTPLCIAAQNGCVDDVFYSLHKREVYQNKILIAKKLLKNGVTANIISESTDLSQEIVEIIAKEEFADTYNELNNKENIDGDSPNSDSTASSSSTESTNQSNSDSSEKIIDDNHSEDDSSNKIYDNDESLHYAVNNEDIIDNSNLEQKSDQEVVGLLNNQVTDKKKSITVRQKLNFEKELTANKTTHSTQVLEEIENNLKQNANFSISNGYKTFNLDESYSINNIRGSDDLTQEGNELHKELGRRYNVPDDGHCLFWAVALAYLIPSIENKNEFTIRFKKLFGYENISDDIEYIKHKLINSFNYSFLKHDIKISNLIKCWVKHVTEQYHNENVKVFLSPKKVKNPQKIQEYAKQIQAGKIWGGSAETEAMTLILNINIKVYTNDDSSELYPINQQKGNCNMIVLHYVNSITGQYPNANHYVFSINDDIPLNDALNVDQADHLVDDIIQVTIKQEIESDEDIDLGDIMDLKNTTILAGKQIINDFGNIFWPIRNTRSKKENKEKITINYKGKYSKKIDKDKGKKLLEKFKDFYVENIQKGNFCREELLKIEKVTNDDSREAMRGQEKAVTVQDIEEGEILGIYTGILLKDNSKDMRAELDWVLEKFGKGHGLAKLQQYFFDVYLHGREEPLVLSAYGRGNKLTKINAPHTHYPLEQNLIESNVDCVQIDYNKIPFITFYTIKKIKEGEELLFDYGLSYWQAVRKVQELPIAYPGAYDHFKKSEYYKEEALNEEYQNFLAFVCKNESRLYKEVKDHGIYIDDKEKNILSEELDIKDKPVFDLMKSTSDQLVARFYKTDTVNMNLLENSLKKSVNDIKISCDSDFIEFAVHNDDKRMKEIEKIFQVYDELNILGDNIVPVTTDC